MARQLPWPLSCALWYRELLTRAYGNVPTKFGKRYITLYLNGSVRVGVSARKKPRANLIVHFLEGNFPEVTAYLTRAEIPFVPRDNKTLIFNVDLQELKNKQPIHESLVQRLLGSSRSAGLPDIAVAETSGERLAEGTGDKLRRFWEGLLSRPTVKATRHAKLSPGEYHWIGAGCGVRGLSLNYVIGQDEGRVELYINRRTGKAEENKQIFDRLREYKAKVDAAFGTELAWQRLDQKVCSRIEYLITLGGYRTDESKWPDIQDAMIDAMIRLDRALTPSLAKLKTELT